MQIAKTFGNNPLISYAQIFGHNNFNSYYLQILRWKRKPIWLPTAKSKVFRVPQRPIISTDEYLEIQRLYNNYRTYYRSVRKHFIQTVEANQVQFDPTVLEKTKEKDFCISYEINAEWNKKIAKEREIRLKSEKEVKKILVVEAIERRKTREEAINLQVNKKVQELKKITSTFVTRENIDVVLNEVLNTTIDYNKAIDFQGNWIKDENQFSKVNKNEVV